MKMIEAIIQPFKLDDVIQALKQVGVNGLTVSEVRGFGRQKGKTISYRGAVSEASLLPRLKLEIIVSERAIPAVREAILRSARTGEVGDGKIFIYSLDAVSRIRTREKEESAI